MEMISYAQNFEDVLLNRIFAGTFIGFYIDVGAHHPVIDSVTKAFYERGWSGINIEPGEIFEELKTDRPRDVNLRLAISDHTGEVTFGQRPAGYSGLSHIEEPEKVADRFAIEPEKTLVTVPCDTLANVIEAYGNGRPISFLKIDVEGSEGAIIHSTDWRTIRPTVMVIEVTVPLTNEIDNQSWEPALLEQGYVRAYFDGINCFYVPEERSDLLRHFKVPINVLDGFIKLNRDLFICLEHAKATAQLQAEMQALIQRINAELADVRHENSRLHGEIDRLHDEEIDLRHDLAAMRKTEGEAQRSLASALHDQTELYVTLSRSHAGQVALLEVDRQRIAVHADAVSAALALAQQRDVFLTAEAARLDRLIRDLHWPGGPRAIRLVLPLARLIRRASGTKAPPILPEEVSLAAVATPVSESKAVALAVPAPVPVSQPMEVALPRRRSIKKRLALLAYAPLRPFGRPMAWRLRSFFSGGIDDKLAVIERDLHGTRIHDEQRMSALFAQLRQIDHRLDTIAVASAQQPDIGKLHGELRQFGKMLDDTLLTLVLERDTPC